MKQKVNLKLYSDFLVANNNRYSGSELARVAPGDSLAHDSVNRWLLKSDFSPSDLWREVKPLVETERGYLIVDDTLLEKPYSRKSEATTWHYSGVRHDIMRGICLVNLLWTGGNQYVPVDYRLYNKKNDDKTKNDHFQDMLVRARQRGFTPQYVLMDSWYGNVANCKRIVAYGWHWITNLKNNRQVSEVKGTYVRVADLNLGEKQLKHVWLKDYGFVVVGKRIDKDGDVTYIASDDVSLTQWEELIAHWEHRWEIETFHRGIKQTTGIAGCYSVKRHSQETHIFASMIAFARLEKRRQEEQISWYEQKASITRAATRTYLASA